MFAEVEVPLREHLLLIEPGMNVFNVFLEDVGAFTAMIQDAGVTIKNICQIGAEDPVSTSDGMLRLDW